MYTEEGIEKIIRNYHQLRDKAEEFVRQYDDGNRRDPRNVQIDYNGNITYEKNTACHCHPEFESFEISAETFNEWLIKNQ